MKKETLLTRIVKLVNFIVDTIFPKIFWLFWPVKVFTSFFVWLQKLTWFISNEYTKRQLGSCGRGVRIYGRFGFTGGKNIYLGNNVHINENAFFRGDGGLYIGDNTHISRNLVIYTVNHQYQGKRLPYDEQKVLKPVIIGSNVWIGTHVLVVPGVTIGDGAIVGMGTVVSHDVPPLGVVGLPPQQILKRRDESHYAKLVSAKAFGGMSGYKWEE